VWHRSDILSTMMRIVATCTCVAAV